MTFPNPFRILETLFPKGLSYVKEDSQDPGGLTIVKVGFHFASCETLKRRQLVVSFWRNAILCLSKVLGNGLQIVKKFNFILISFAFVLHITCSRFLQLQSTSVACWGASLPEAQFPSSRAGICSGSMVICTILFFLSQFPVFFPCFKAGLLCLVSAGLYWALLGRKKTLSLPFSIH